MTDSALSTHSLSRLDHARALQRRPSATATICRAVNCGKYHFRLGDYCPEHDELVNTPVEIPTAIADGSAATSAAGTTANTSGVSGKEMNKLAVECLKAAELRRQMIWMRDFYHYNVSEEVIKAAQQMWYAYCQHKYGKKQIKAKSGMLSEIIQNIGMNNAMPDIELGQLLLQFQRLDVSGDGTITHEDLRTLIELYVDAEWVKNNDAATVESKLKEWIVSSKQMIYEKASNIPRPKPEEIVPSFSFPEYVDALLRLREWEWESPSVELFRTGFWDLRGCILFMPPPSLFDITMAERKGRSAVENYYTNTTSGSRGYWLHKRGDYFASRSLNGWKKRLFLLKKPTEGESAAATPSAPTLGSHFPASIFEYWDGANITGVVVNDENSDDEQSEKTPAPTTNGAAPKPSKRKGQIQLTDIRLVNFSPSDNIQVRWRR